MTFLPNLKTSTYPLRLGPWWKRHRPRLVECYRRHAVYCTVGPGRLTNVAYFAVHWIDGGTGASYRVEGFETVGEAERYIDGRYSNPKLILFKSGVDGEAS